MEKIKDALVRTFDEFDESDFHENLRMKDVPGFDSLNAVNFLLELEESYDVDLSNSFVLETKTVRDILDEVEKKQSN